MDSGYLGWNGEWGFLNRILDCIINLVTTYQLKYGQTNGWNGYVVGWTAVLPFTLFDENLFYLTGMK